jgi:hypothetical protein
VPRVALRFDSPDDARHYRLGRKGKAAGFTLPGGFAVTLNSREKCVMPGRNWSRLKRQSLMRRHGVEDVKGKMPVLEPAKEPRRRLSKAELREQAEAAVVAWRAGQTSKNK